MSLPREWNYQDSRGSVYGQGEPHPIGRVEYKSGRFLRTSTDSGCGSIHHTPRMETGGADTPDVALVACSQPVPSSLLAECQQSCGSLFSIVSAPPLPLAELDVKQFEAAGLQQHGGAAFVEKIGGGSAVAPQPPRAASQLSTTSSSLIDGAAGAAAPPMAMAMCRRPATLPLESSYLPRPQSRTLHASLLEHQISEIEEEDNENLLTVSSITARPLIAKSREIRSTAAGKRPSVAKSGSRPTSKRNAAAAAKKVEAGGKQKSSSSHSSVSADPPDGGYGWLIVFGAFSVQFWVAGLVKSYGVLFVEIMETFPNSTAAVASWIPAILSALCLALAPLSSALCTKYSCRSVVFVGGLFCALGLTLSYFATSLIHLLLTFGVLTGIGGGLSTTPGIVIVSQYFDKHRALANGICVSGTAAGSFILPVLIKHLNEEFGFHGTILILGGCMLHVCMSATLYRPLEAHCEKSVDPEEDPSKPLNDDSGMMTHSTYLNTCDEPLNSKFIEHLFLEESKNKLNDLYTNRSNDAGLDRASAQESDDEVKDVIGETTFIKPMKKVRSSGIMHSVEDLSTDSTWMYRKHSGTDSNRGSRRRRNVFANDEIISKIQAHLEKPLSSPTVVTRGLSKSMEIPTPVSNFSDGHTTTHEAIIGENNAQAAISEEDEQDEVAAVTCCERFEMYLDLSLLKDYQFILMCLSVTLMSVGCPYMLYFLPAHALSIGCNKSMAGYLVAISAVLDLFGRLGLGWLCDLQLFDRRKTYIFCIFGAGVAVLTIPFEHKIYQVGISAAIYGFCLGSWYVLVPVLLADIFGTDRISSSYGLVRMFQSIGAISVPPLAGYLRDLSGNYEICFYCMGSCMIMGCVPLLVWALIEHRDEQRLDAEQGIAATAAAVANSTTTKS